MKRLDRLAFIFLCCGLAVPASGQSDAQANAIRAEIKALEGRDFGCTRARKLLRTLRVDYPDYHFVFAGRKAATITGIRGCGYAWGTDLGDVQTRAMTACRRQEAKLGTGPQGERTCRILE